MDSPHIHPTDSPSYTPLSLKEIFQESFRIFTLSWVAILVYTGLLGIVLLIGLILSGVLGFLGVIVLVAIFLGGISGYYLLAHQATGVFYTDFTRLFKGLRKTISLLPLAGFCLIPSFILTMLFAVFAFGAIGDASIIVTIILGLLVFMSMLVIALFAIPLMVHHNQKARPAIGTSFKAIKTDFRSIASLVAILLLLNGAGLILLGLGLCVTLPFTFFAISIASRSLYAIEQKDPLEALIGELGQEQEV